MDKYAFLWQKLDEYFQGKYWFKPIGSRYKELIKKSSIWIYEEDNYYFKQCEKSYLNFLGIITHL